MGLWPNISQSKDCPLEMRHVEQKWSSSSFPAGGEKWRFRSWKFSANWTPCHIESICSNKVMIRNWVSQTWKSIFFFFGYTPFLKCKGSPITHPEIKFSRWHEWPISVQYEYKYESLSPCEKQDRRWPAHSQSCFHYSVSSLLKLSWQNLQGSYNILND